jgi:hypothetical protein
MALLPQSHDCSCYVSRLAPPPLWLQKHTDLRAHDVAHSLDLWRQPRLANVTCAWCWRLCGIKSVVLTHVRVFFHAGTRPLARLSRKLSWNARWKPAIELFLVKHSTANIRCSAEQSAMFLLMHCHWNQTNVVERISTLHIYPTCKCVTFRAPVSVYVDMYIDYNDKYPQQTRRLGV